MIDNKLDKLQELKCASVACKVFTVPVTDPDYIHLAPRLVHQGLEKTAEIDMLVDFHYEELTLLEHQEEKSLASGKQLIRQDSLDFRPVVCAKIAVENLLSLTK